MSKDDKENNDPNVEFEEKQSGPVLETVKKLFSVGLSAAFLTEESIRQYLGEVKLPKDVLGFVIQSANKGKEELVGRVSKEIGTILSKIDIVKEASKFAENHKFKVTAEIEIQKKGDS
ncbi:MAG: hypothetical protein IT289_11090 [Oligoflexia bacterium]|nr:hypothetical protein [Oligoflexia bacterium]